MEKPINAAALGLKPINEADYDFSKTPSADSVASMGLKPINEADYDFDNPLPEYANGMSPDAPINRSPISADERLRLALGNERGNMDYLQKKFGMQNVTRLESGALSVKDKDGLWKAVDPDTLSEADPWKITTGIVRGLAGVGAAVGNLMTGGAARMAAEEVAKGKSLGEAVKAIPQRTAEIASKVAGSNEVAQEVVGEYAENLPTAAATGALIGTGGAAGGLGVAGQALVAGGSAMGVRGLQTVMGKALGTFEATPEEWARDIATEGLLNMGGVAVGAGIKPTAGFLAKTDAVKKMGEVLGKMDDGARGLIKKVYGGLSGLGDDGIDAIAQRGTLIQQQLKEVSSKGLDKAQVMQVNDMREIIQSLKASQGHIYRSMKNDVLRAIPKNFDGKVGDILDEPLKSLDDLGFFKRSTETRVPRQQLSFLSAPKTFDVTRLELKSADEIAKDLLKRGVIKEADLALDSDVYKAIKEFSEIALKYKDARRLGGKAAAEQLIDAASGIKNITYKYKVRGDTEGIKQLSTYFSRFADQVDNAMTRVLDSGAARGPYSRMNQTYSQMSELLEEAAHKARLGDNALETYVNQLSSRAGRMASKKESFDAALDLAERYRAPQASRAATLRDRISDRAMALRFSNVAGQKPWMQSAAAGMAGTALATGNVGMAAAIAGGAALRSPMVQSRALLGMMQLSTMVRGMKPLERIKFVTDSRFIVPAVNTAISAQQERQEMRNVLLQSQGLGQ